MVGAVAMKNIPTCHLVSDLAIVDLVGEKILGVA